MIHASHTVEHTTAVNAKKGQFVGQFNMLWEKLYKSHPKGEELRKETLKMIDDFYAPEQYFLKKPQDWYKKTVIYSLYIDLFNKTFTGLTEKINHFQNLGVDTLWVLPIMDSPQKDNGYDIRNYKKLYYDLFQAGLEAKKHPEMSQEEADKMVFDEFQTFIAKAHEQGVKLIIDIPLNHTSDENEWFVQEKAKKVENPVADPQNDFYLWSEDPEMWNTFRILFEGMEKSNWEPVQTNAGKDLYYFHRFYKMQPDLNFRNPQVMYEMLNILLFWIAKGVDGIRLDAIPFLHKEDKKNPDDKFFGENLEQTHTIVQVFRTMVDMIDTKTLLLAEACQPPNQIIKYFGVKGGLKECHAAYHFPLMNKIFYALCSNQSEPIVDLFTNPNSVIAAIPEDCQWFTFLRCHDELTLEMVDSEEERRVIHTALCKKPEWNFRCGYGVAGRLYSMFEGNIDKIQLVFSILLTLAGTPLLYHGDEMGSVNDEEFFHKKAEFRGNSDARDLNRGPIQWERLNTPEGKEIFSKLQKMIKKRKQNIDVITQKNVEFQNHPKVLAYMKKNLNSPKQEVMWFVHNLSDEVQEIEVPGEIQGGMVQHNDLLSNEVASDKKKTMVLKPFQTSWVYVDKYVLGAFGN